MISFHFSSSWLSSSCTLLDLLFLFALGSSVTVWRIYVGRECLNSSSSIIPSWFSSNILNKNSKFFLVSVFWWSIAPVMNSWKSILPSPSKSTCLNTSYHFDVILYASITLVAYLNSLPSKKPFWSLSRDWNAICNFFRSVLSVLSPISNDTTVFWNLSVFEKLARLFEISF